MSRFEIIVAASLFCVLNLSRTQAESNGTPNEKGNEPTIVVTKLAITEKTLKLNYEIRNDSEDDAWILVGWYYFHDSSFASGMAAGLRISEDGHTITIGARFNRPSSGGGIAPGYGRFVRLRPGDSQTESIFIRLPACPASRSEHVGQQEQGIKYATRLAIELGYFQDNLSDEILKTPIPHENALGKEPNDTLVSRSFSYPLNERLNSRDDELLIVDDRLEVKRREEQIVRTVIENVRIPYAEKRDYTTKIKPPGLHSYEKIEIRYKPSILDFFFPYKSQQSLLNPDEMEYLQSDKTTVLNNEQDIHTVAHFIPHTRSDRTVPVHTADATVWVGLPVRYRSHAEVLCYSGGEPFLSFLIYNDDAIVIDGYKVLSLEGFPGLKKLTPEIQAIDLRTRCAANLKNQWYRFRYNMRKVMRQNDPPIRNHALYPTPSEWCDDILREYPLFGRGYGRLNPEPHICPSAGEGRNHYAMNPNCRPDSPADRVLLFETKAGWNQHGGPELFTFDNHDPKGGCVLLNDGTVKFIRTDEELRRLRWE